jgi:hypothetical protein
MKQATAKSEPVTREKFEKFAKALMAVPKKELDKEIAKDDQKKHVAKRRKQA